MAEFTQGPVGSAPAGERFTQGGTDPCSAQPERPTPGPDELTEGLLDLSTLEDWLDDVTQLTEVQEVLTKGGPQERAQDGGADLRLVVQALRAGQVRGVQVRYRWGGQDWLDTLLPHPEGLRLIRRGVN